MRTLFFSAVFLFLLASHTQAQKSWRVNNIPAVNADFTTLSAAVAAASDGDTIYLESSPNNYSGSVTLTKRLVIMGTGYFLSREENEKTQWNKDEARITSTLTFNAGSTGSVLSGLTTSTININVGGIILERNYLSTVNIANAANSNADTCIFRQNFFNGSVNTGNATGTASNLLFHNNIFRGGSIDFRSAIDNTTAYFINNNFVYHNGIYTGGCIFQNNIFLSPSFSTYLAGNAFYNNIVNNTSIPAGNDNQRSVNLNDVYVNYNNGGLNPSTGFSDDGRFQLKSGSPAAGAGVLNGVTVDCGAFGGPAPYVLSGMPPIPSIYKLTVPQQVNSGVPTMTISISSASH